MIALCDITFLKLSPVYFNPGQKVLISTNRYCFKSVLIVRNWLLCISFYYFPGYLVSWYQFFFTSCNPFEWCFYILMFDFCQMYLHSVVFFIFSNGCAFNLDFLFSLFRAMLNCWPNYVRMFSKCDDIYRFCRFI